MKNCVVLIFVTCFFIPFFLNADTNRFSRVLEYEIMDSCVKEDYYRKAEKIKICACAMEKTNENGFFPDYDNDADFKEDEADYLNKFERHIKICSKKLPETFIEKVKTAIPLLVK